VSIFEERGLTPNIQFSSPSIEMVRGMVGRGFGFSILVTRPHSPFTYDGQKLVCVPLVEHVTGSGLCAAWLHRAQLTKPAQLFVDHCRDVLAPTPARSHRLPAALGEDLIAIPG
jgi:DNA-binding transcriptional LysR family regulator